jgi:hypothetical protein
MEENLSPALAGKSVCLPVSPGKPQAVGKILRNFGTGASMIFPALLDLKETLRGNWEGGGPTKSPQPLAGALSRLSANFGVALSVGDKGKIVHRPGPFVQMTVAPFGDCRLTTEQQ